MEVVTEQDIQKFTAGAPADRVPLDKQGETVSAVRMDASLAYRGIPGLLQRYIDQEDQAAWEEICDRIDYIFTNLDQMLTALDRETGFGERVRTLAGEGRVVLFKPNAVGPMAIDAYTHGEGPGAIICTEWSFVAAVMRWFHDRLGLDYHQMALGEASTTTFLFAELFSRTMGRTFTTEAILEGRSGDNFGGWGFFFARRYLADRHPAGHRDDPLLGYQDSETGRYLPPGQATDRLMVYDLNRIDDEPYRGRTVPVPDGVNFAEITLHKAIIGGDPADPKDREDYPGCVLVNLPKLKIHAQDLITNAVKNLGIGLYPTRCEDSDGRHGGSWKYACPSGGIPTYKAKIPHSPWMIETDDHTNLPVQGEDGKYILVKTGGMSGTQVDIIRAVQDQQVFMIHVVDAIDTINLSHNPDGKAVRVPEGYAWSSLDCVALDLCCARYCFKTLPMEAGLEMKEKHGWQTEFVHHVPVAAVEGTRIVSREGLDSPLFRYNLYRYAEERGVGRQHYHVVGFDGVRGVPLASRSGHLVSVENGEFHELMTETMYYNPSTILHDLQKTILSYLEAHDQLTGSTLLQEFLAVFDENGDGMIDYDEMGRMGVETAQLRLLAHTLDLRVSEDYGAQRGGFLELAYYIKHCDPRWNPAGHDFTRERLMMMQAAEAFKLSQSDQVTADPFFQGMAYGGGMWPSWQTVIYTMHTGMVYGAQSLATISPWSLYGNAFQYADKLLNGGRYTGSPEQGQTDPGALAHYFQALSEGKDPLDFTVYVPAALGGLRGQRVPNVVETDDPEKIFTAHFAGGREVWGFNHCLTRSGRRTGPWCYH